MARKTGLGRGLDALIPPGENGPQAGINYVPVDRIAPNPRQPRSHFDPEELAELAASIREHGILQPLNVTYDPTTDQYTLISGERRLVAARQAGLDRVPALVREASEQQRLELALIENLQRTDLGALEAAEAYRQLAEDFNLSHEDISAQVGKSRAAITNTLRLLKLPETVRHALENDQISEGHARVLLALPHAQAQAAVLQTILAQGLNVRQTEDLVRRWSGQKPTPPERPAPPPEIAALEERLRDRLGTRVTLNHRKRGGTLIIHYYSDEELNALVDQIMGKQE